MRSSPALGAIALVVVMGAACSDPGAPPTTQASPPQASPTRAIPPAATPTPNHGRTVMDRMRCAVGDAVHGTRADGGKRVKIDEGPVVALTDPIVGMIVVAYRGSLVHVPDASVRPCPFDFRMDLDLRRRHRICVRADALVVHQGRVARAPRVLWNKGTLTVLTTGEVIRFAHTPDEKPVAFPERYVKDCGRPRGFV